MSTFKIDTTALQNGTDRMNMRGVYIVFDFPPLEWPIVATVFGEIPD